MLKPKLYFQDLILALQKFWAKKNCVLLQPYDMELGAGTFHPGTFLRTIGPEPWRAAFVQPSRRPTDARYGDSPNRLGCYYQFQVVLKPSPSDIQHLYLASLAKLGIMLEKHDVRFVEDNWESPTLGAWGVGWEVWLDGMEVSQFTYFQQIGGLNCNPVSGELTYGLERLAMYLQNRNNVFNLSWNKNIKYGDMFRQNEAEQSSYNFKLANADFLFTRFYECEKSHKLLVEQLLPYPAYEQVLQASHIFNLLDARQAVSVTDRARFISIVRNMSKKVARCYYDSREKLGFPMLGSAGNWL